MTKSTPLRIGLIGECMIQLQAHPDGSIEKTFAGDTLNTATYLARLKKIHGADVDYITALGEDGFSQEMIEQFKGEGIGTEHIRILPNKLPGLYYVNIDEAGERSFLYWRGESAAKELFKGSTKPAVTTLADYDYLYLSGISLAILDCESRNRLLELLEKARAMGSKICFDNNYRPRLWKTQEDAQIWYSRVYRMTDYAFLTFEDEQMMWGDETTDQTLARYTKLDISNITIKCGADPCLIQSPDFTGQVSAQKIAGNKVVDTNAAGDSFSAGYLCGLLAQFDSPTQCAHLGHQVAGTVIQHRGAVIDPQPIENLVAEFIN